MPADLWGDIPAADSVRSAHDILVEQGNLLSEKTGARLVGEVFRKVYDSGNVTVDFYITVPALNTYRYQVCLALYSITKIWPTELRDFQNKATYSVYRCADEAEFKKALGDIFKSDRVKHAIASLLAQVGK